MERYVSAVHDAPGRIRHYLSSIWKVEGSNLDINLVGFLVVDHSGEVELHHMKWACWWRVNVHFWLSAWPGNGLGRRLEQRAVFQYTAPRFRRIHRVCPSHWVFLWVGVASLLLGCCSRRMRRSLARHWVLLWVGVASLLLGCCA
jgi:hypothetical protein